MVEKADPEKGSSRSESPFPPPYLPPPYSAEDDTVASAVTTSEPNVVPNIAPHTHVDPNFESHETYFSPFSVVTTTTTLNSNNNDSNII